MLVIEDVAAIREVRRELGNATLGFVPTMGALHAGHLSLIDIARKHAQRVIVSIFVNPSQFNDKNDYAAYTRDLPRDLALLKDKGVDFVFTPSEQMMYGEGFESWVDVERFSLPFEGASRPGHFRGVATVVSMLFNLVQPTAAIFGEKDFQQLRLIERMVEDLKFSIQIVRGPIVREADGLAMSSRNVRLSAEGRKQALGLSAALHSACGSYESGARSVREILECGLNELKNFSGIELVYFDAVDERNLTSVSAASSQTRLLIAGLVDGVRLIDNINLIGDGKYRYLLKNGKTPFYD